MNINIISNLQIKTNSIKFKGHIIGTDPGVMISYSNSGPDTYAFDSLPEGATPNYEGAYPHRGTKIYKAAPFEIIPEEVYRSTDYILRDDLYLSQIKKDYKSGYKNFAANANEERKFAEEKIDLNNKKINQQYEEIEKHREEIKKVRGVNNGYGYTDYYTSERRNGWQAIEHHLDEINDKNEKINSLNEKNKVWLENKEKANERYNVLKDVDDLAGKKQSNIDAQRYYEEKINSANSARYYKEKIQDEIKNGKALKNKEKGQLAFIAQKDSPEIVKKQTEIIKAKYKPMYEKILENINYYIRSMQGEKAKIPEYKKHIQEIIKNRTVLEAKMEKAIEAVEKLYKAKYPHWL